MKKIYSTKNCMQFRKSSSDLSVALEVIAETSE